MTAVLMSVAAFMLNFTDHLPDINILLVLITLYLPELKIYIYYGGQSPGQTLPGQQPPGKSPPPLNVLFPHDHKYVNHEAFEV